MNDEHVHVGACIDVGYQRASNQDTYLAKNGVYIVCDGMGGARGGERASAIAAQEFAQLVALRKRSRETIEQAVTRAQTLTRALGNELGGIAGTTLSGVIISTWHMHSAQALAGGDVPLCYVVNIGDSRTYHLSTSNQEEQALGYAYNPYSLVQITHDHSRRQEIIDAGIMSEQEANQCVARNVITRCIGAPSGAQLDVFTAQPRGRFIICSDGCHGEISDQCIAQTAARYERAQDAANALLAASLQAGGHDNVTVLVVDFPTVGKVPAQWSCAPEYRGDEPIEDITMQI